MCYLETGKGWAGLGIIAIRILLKWSFSRDAKFIDDAEGALVLSTKVFFLFGAAVVLAGIAACIALFRSPWASSRLEVYYSMPERSAELGDGSGSVTSSPMSPPSSLKAKSKAEYSPVLARPRKRSFAPQVKAAIAKRIAAPAAGVFLSFVVCIACFPGIATSMHSTTLDLGSW